MLTHSYHLRYPKMMAVRMSPITILRICQANSNCHRNLEVVEALQAQCLGNYAARLTMAVQMSWRTPAKKHRMTMPKCANDQFLHDPVHNAEAVSYIDVLQPSQSRLCLVLPSRPCKKLQDLEDTGRLDCLIFKRQSYGPHTYGAYGSVGGA